MKEQKIRVDVYSLPKDNKIESGMRLRAFLDIPVSKAGELLVYLAVVGKPVIKGNLKLKK